MEVHNFIHLLTKIDEPTLAEYERFGGECGGESELGFLLAECRSRSWANNSKPCVNFTQKRCRFADENSSLALNWLRKQFDTVGKDYHIVNVELKHEGFEHDLVKVKIGENYFLLFYNKDSNVPTGLLVGVLEVNGKKIDEYMTYGNDLSGQ